MLIKSISAQFITTSILSTGILKYISTVSNVLEHAKAAEKTTKAAEILAFQDVSHINITEPLPVSVTTLLQTMQGVIHPTEKSFYQILSTVNKVTVDRILELTTEESANLASVYQKMLEFGQVNANLCGLGTSWYTLYTHLGSIKNATDTYNRIEIAKKILPKMYEDADVAKNNLETLTTNMCFVTALAVKYTPQVALDNPVATGAAIAAMIVAVYNHNEIQELAMNCYAKIIGATDSLADEAAEL